MSGYFKSDNWRITAQNSTGGDFFTMFVGKSGADISELPSDGIGWGSVAYIPGEGKWMYNGVWTAIS
jgi:hypothetical protein